jgi:hypothetical protein
MLQMSLHVAVTVETDDVVSLMINGTEELPGD